MNASIAELSVISKKTNAFKHNYPSIGDYLFNLILELGLLEKKNTPDHPTDLCKYFAY